jgi:putative membrane protein
MYDYRMMNGDGGAWGFVMILFMFVFLVIAVIVAVHLLRGHQYINKQQGDPIDIVKERYAKGEIDKEEFERLKKDLR